MKKLRLIEDFEHEYAEVFAKFSEEKAIVLACLPTKGVSASAVVDKDVKEGSATNQTVEDLLSGFFGNLAHGLALPTE